MISRLAHLLCLAVAAPSGAVACGAPGAAARIESVAADGEIRLAGGVRARLGGLALDPAAAPALAARAGAAVRVADLAPAADRWGRRVVDLIDADGQSVALDLIARGLARVRPEPETRACEAERLDAEAGARAAEEGVWSRPGAILAAEDAAGLRQADGRFTLVSGRVRRVGAGRTKVYLDFASPGGFSVVVARKAESQFRRAGLDLRALSERKVIVRGVVDVRFGPRIEVADPSMIELESAKETSRGQ